ncbi:MAG: SulP family inorganic anion transporter [Chlamydiota bacterium]
MRFSVHYRWVDLLRDCLAGLSIACLVIPQAIAYALLANLPLVSGLYAAIFGTLIATCFFRSDTLISGPSTAIAILVQTTILSMQSGRGPPHNLLEILAHLLFLVGFIHICLSLCHIGACLQFVSRSVLLGYFTGLSAVICIEQLFSWVQVERPEATIFVTKILYLARQVDAISWSSTSLGALGLLLLVGMRRYAPSFPGALLWLFFSTFLVYMLPVYSALPTLSQYSSMQFSVEMTLPSFRLELLQELFFPALAIAFLGVLEVFSVSKALSLKTRQPIDGDREVLAIGLANVFLTLFPFAMPASASITRSLLGQMMGAKTKIAPIMSTVFVYAILVFLWPFVAYVPVAALSSLLIFSGLHIVDPKAVQHCFRATKEDAFIFLFTFSLCMLLRLDIAFVVGVLFSIVFYLRTAATPHVQEYAFDYAGRLSIIQPHEGKHSKVRIIGIGGELFFGMVDVLEGVISNLARDEDVKVVILRLNNVHYVDGSMCLAIVQLHEQLASTGRHLILSGITEKVWYTLSRAKVLEKMQAINFFLRDETRPQLSTWKACLRAEELLSRRGSFDTYPEGPGHI